MTDVTLILEHASGKHRGDRVEGCRACEGLPPLPVASSAEAPTPATKTPRRAKKVRGGICEHCGCPTAGGRFAPGHDAKLKRDLVAQVEKGDVEAYAELFWRHWTSQEMDRNIDRRFQDAALIFVNTGGSAWFEARIADRMAGIP